MVCLFLVYLVCFFEQRNRYLLQFDHLTTGFICPRCQGICTCVSCKPNNRRTIKPIAMDPFAPSLIAKQAERDRYVPPDHAKKAWKLNQRAWKVMQGLARSGGRPRKSLSIK